MRELAAKLAAKLDAEPGRRPVALVRIASRSLAWRVRLASWFVRAHIDRFARAGFALGSNRPATVRVRLLMLRLRATQARTASAWIAIGDRADSFGDIDLAFRTYSRALELEPESLVQQWRLAGMQYARGDYAGAMRSSRQAIETQHALARARGLDRLGIRLLGPSWLGVIGHMALLDVYVKLAALEQMDLRSTILVGDPQRSSNPAYARYWRAFFPVAIDNASAVGALSGIWPYLEQHITMFMLPDGRLRTLHQTASEVEERWRAEGRGPLLRLTEEDEERGRQTLERLGVPRDAWFVGLHVREGGSPSRDIHDADIATYGAAIEEISARGGWIIRMGHRAMRPAPGLPNVVDYARSRERVDWMDVFLWARSRFFIGTTSGPVGIPPTFGVPCVQTNWAPLAFRHWFPGDLVVPKLYTREGRVVGVAELLSASVGYATDTGRLRSRMGVEVVDNTSGEIAEVVVEMIERLEGVARYEAQDEALQERFESLHPEGEFAYRPASRVGREWLRRHQDLLV